LAELKTKNEHSIENEEKFLLFVFIKQEEIVRVNSKILGILKTMLCNRSEMMLSNISTGAEKATPILESRNFFFFKMHLQYSASRKTRLHKKKNVRVFNS
jgi:hypothetical protein